MSVPVASVADDRLLSIGVCGVAFAQVLRGFPGLRIKRISSKIAIDDIDAGHEQAREVARAGGYDVVFWGEIVEEGEKVVVRIFHTASDAFARELGAALRPAWKELALPELGRRDLGGILEICLAVAAADLAMLRGYAVAARLRPCIARAQRLQSSLDHSEAFGALEFLIGRALAMVGEEERRAEELLEAVRCYRVSLAAWEWMPFQWAAAQYRLGNALRCLAELGDEPQRLREAVDAYHAAALTWSGAVVALPRAEAQWALGRALRRLSEVEIDRDLLLGAVEAYRAAYASLDALCERRARMVECGRGLLAHELGNALLALGEGESGTRRLEEAVAMYRGAFVGRTRERLPHDWAVTCNNLAVALVRLGERLMPPESVECFTEAAEACADAVAVWRGGGVEFFAAIAESNRGRALHRRGELEADRASLEEAVAAYRAALFAIARESEPLRWATIQSHLAGALQTLGEREIGTERLEEALAAYWFALGELSRERVPLDWAALMCARATTLRLMAERGAGLECLEEAGQAYREALRELSPERVPLQWASAQSQYGYVLALLGMRENGKQQLREALEAHRAALTVFTRERTPAQWAAARSNLDTVTLLLSEPKVERGVIEAEAVPA